MSPKFAAVVAVTKEWGIGNNGQLPWHPKRLQLDMAWLKYVTTHRYAIEQGLGEAPATRVQFSEQSGKNAVIMGRKTWDSIPKRFRPMEDRINIIITSNPESFMEQTKGLCDVYAAGSFESAVSLAEEKCQTSQIFILGGSAIYEAAANDKRCEAIFVTRLTDHPAMPCTTFFPGSTLSQYPIVCNITETVSNTLKSTLANGSSIETLLTNAQGVIEHGISYGIYVYTQ